MIGVSSSVPTRAVLPPRALRLSGYAVALWSLAYMLPHLYWAFGGTFGLSAVVSSAPKLAEWRSINGAASVILSLAALLGIGFVWTWGKRRLRWPVLAIAWAGCSIAIAHGLYGIAARARTVLALASGERELDLARHGWLLWDLIVFEPWFLIEGLLLAMAGWHFLAHPGERSRWIVACIAGVGAAAAAALAELKIG